MWCHALSLPITDVPEQGPIDLWHDPGSGWKLRYWCILTGHALSLVGSALTQFVLLWWITDTTGSVSALAMAGMVSLLPQALLGPLGGVLADRYSRSALMIVAHGTSALCMLVLIGLFLTGHIEFWHAYVMMGIRGAVQAFQSPAAAASAVMLVPADFLPRAAGLNQILISLTTVVAAPLGAVALGTMSISLALSIDVVTALLGIIPFLIFRVPQPESPKVEQTSVWSEFRDGVGLVWNHRGLRHLFALLGVVVLFIMPSSTLVPLLVKEHFVGGTTEVAIMEGFAGAAIIAGGLIVITLSPKRHILWILWGSAASCFALALAALMPMSLFWAAAAWWALSTGALVIGDAPLTALLQSIIPKHQQGRVLSLLTSVVTLAGPVGLALAGLVGELVGVRWLFVLMGLLAGCMSLLGFCAPALLQIDREG
jgi:MFS transporter, DHA3 family, macrolide efflux protein